MRKFKIDIHHAREQGRKFDAVCRRLYACDKYEITPTERIILMRTNIDYAALVDEVTRLRDKLTVIESRIKQED